MTLSEDLIQLKTNVNEIFASKNIGESQTRGLNDNFDVIIAALKSQEKPAVKATVPSPINIQIKQK